MDRMKKLYGRPLGGSKDLGSSSSIKRLRAKKDFTRKSARSFLKEELIVQLTEIPLSTEDEAHVSYLLLEEELRAEIAYLTQQANEVWEKYCDDDSFQNYDFYKEVVAERERTIEWYERATGLTYKG